MAKMLKGPDISPDGGTPGAPGVAAAPAPRVTRSGNDAGDFDVIVVGSGVGGMGAAQKLRLHGLRAVVLEA